MDRATSASPGRQKSVSAGANTNNLPPLIGEQGEAWLRAFAGLIESAQVTTDLDFTITYWPPAAEALVGWPAYRAIGSSICSVLAQPRSELNKLVEEISLTGAAQKLVLPARNSGAILGELEVSLCLARDDEGSPLGVAWLLRAPRACRQTTAEAPSAETNRISFFTALSVLPYPFAIADTAGIVRFANSMAQTLLGMQIDTACCSERCAAAGSTCSEIRGNKGLATSHWELSTGEQRFEMSAIPIAPSGEEPEFIVCFGTPGTPRLSDELRNFFRAVDESLLGVVITDATGFIEYGNPQACNIAGCSPAELVNRHARSFYAPASHSSRDDARVPNLSAGIAEFRIVRADGEVRPVRASITDVRNGSGEVTNWVILFDDLSERRNLEARERQLREQVAHSGRLAAIGEIASMITHEIAQPLSSITNFAKGMLHRMKAGRLADDELRASLEEIVRQVERTGSVVSNVRNMARRPNLAVSEVDINCLIADLLPTCFLVAKGTGAHIATELNGELKRVKAEPSQIEQALLNLVRNAVEASLELPEGGRRVVIRTCATDDGGVLIAVEDYAPLPDAKIMERFGQPFFSTKPNGLGLGLSITRSLLENHGSHLEMVPTSGGKSFQFALPSCHGLA